MRSHDVLCHSVIDRVILSASDSLDDCTQVVKFQEDYMTLFFLCIYIVRQFFSLTTTQLYRSFSVISALFKIFFVYLQLKLSSRLALSVLHSQVLIAILY